MNRDKFITHWPSCSSSPSPAEKHAGNEHSEGACNKARQPSEHRERQPGEEPDSWERHQHGAGDAGQLAAGGSRAQAVGETCHGTAEDRPDACTEQRYAEVAGCPTQSLDRLGEQVL